ncbi:type IV pilin protein [Craterilacuibacter sinensis]|uniref:Prepilin-type N-terminal cleavage/methylation domain-containing protein n=1 Tax=Craterilacuibacter sinensis TaxID=2686017 RepID=A0A845BRU0_9NEIS|nr:type IV pilin protein [Craterilacuibacter sinensis]MXR37944.1 prepilin-type N-terminal cleavage/methylation domain-containing protein [Craterilacuibacter sinensis]
MRPFHAGFSLVELMSALLVMAILATVAYPAYRDYVLQARRADGRTALLGLALAQERFRASCPFYAQHLGVVSSCGASAALSTLAFSALSPEGYYAISLLPDSAASTTYLAEAAATDKGGQGADSVCPASVFRLNENGPDMSSAARRVCWGAG